MMIYIMKALPFLSFIFVLLLSEISFAFPSLDLDQDVEFLRRSVKPLGATLELGPFGPLLKRRSSLSGLLGGAESSLGS